MLGNVGVRRGCSRNCTRRGRWSPINQSATILAKSGVSTIWLAAIRTSGFEPGPALVAKGRIRKILRVALRTNHNWINPFHQGGVTSAQRRSKQTTVYYRNALKASKRRDFAYRYRRAVDIRQPFQIVSSNVPQQ